MRCFFSDTFDLKLPNGHRFPGQKYGMLRRALLSEKILVKSELIESPLIDISDILRAHSPTYVKAIETGDIDPKIMRRIGFPWTPHIPIRARATLGGALRAAEVALQEGVSGQLAGGTHHAHYDFGSGYCVFNDFAVAAITLLEEKQVQRIAIIDLDVHQGDGNAAILQSRDDVYVFSMHGEKNFPFRKVESDLDIPLPDGVGDAEYLETLELYLPSVFAFHPDLVLYQAGVDPLRDDRLGRMDLTFDGLMARDRMVLEACRQRNIPISMAIGGGYADPIDMSVKAYSNTYRVVREVFPDV